MCACLVSLWPSSFAPSLPRSLARYHFSPLRSALPLRLSTLAHRSGSNFVVGRLSLSLALSLSLSLSLPLAFPPPCLPPALPSSALLILLATDAAPLLSSLLLLAIYVRIAAVDRPTDRPTATVPSSVQCWRQCSSKKPPPRPPSAARERATADTRPTDVTGWRGPRRELFLRSEKSNGSMFFIKLSDGRAHFVFYFTISVLFNTGPKNKMVQKCSYLVYISILQKSTSTL